MVGRSACGGGDGDGGGGGGGGAPVVATWRPAAPTPPQLLLPPVE